MNSALQARLQVGFESHDTSRREVLYRYLRDSDDLQALTELLHQAYAPLAAAGMRFVASFQDAEVTRSRVQAGETIVAVEGGRIVGTITLKAPGTAHGTAFLERADVASVGQFAVAPSHQGRGIGPMLARLVEQRAGELLARYIALATSERATRLIAAYERQGFRHVESVQWSGLNYRSVVMAKPLATG